MKLQALSRFGSALLLAASAAWPVAAQQIQDSALRQMSSILAMKQSRGSLGGKLSSRLYLAHLKQQGQAVAGIDFEQMPDLPGTASGQVAIDIRARQLQPVIDAIAAAGGKVIYASRYDIRAELPLAEVQKLAALAEVDFVRPADRAHTNSLISPASPFLSPTAPSAARLNAWQEERSRQRTIEQQYPLLASNGFVPVLHSLLRPAHVAPFIGAVTSQGYVAHQANQVVSGGVDGTGVRVGVLSDSASPDRVASLIASGDLPPDVVVLPNQAGDGEDEGTAMMEIVHDLAPGAKLFFATAFSGQASFADNIRTLRYQYGCDIIVDDISYFAEGVFQDTTIARAVNEVTADGALYFSAAANSGNLTSGTSGTWEGDFQAGASATGPIFTAEGAVPLLNFGTTDNPILYNTLKTNATYIGIEWSDAWGASANDYDLFILDAAGSKVLASSTDSQLGRQDPIEAVQKSAGFPAGSRIVIVKHSGADRALHIDTERARLAINTTGATFGHNAGASTVTVAATAWNSARRGTRAFTGAANPVETFSSDGPRKVFYGSNGAPLTPGNYLFGTNGGVTLLKPDLTAADGVTTATPGFAPFFGTSAAAPHAAAIAALVKSANPSLTSAQLRSILLQSTLDTMAPGPDRDAGYGILMAPAAVSAAFTPQF